MNIFSIRWIHVYQNLEIHEEINNAKFGHYFIHAYTKCRIFFWIYSVNSLFLWDECCTFHWKIYQHSFKKKCLFLARPAKNTKGWRKPMVDMTCTLQHLISWIPSREVLYKTILHEKNLEEIKVLKGMPNIPTYKIAKIILLEE